MLIKLVFGSFLVLCPKSLKGMVNVGGRNIDGNRQDVNKVYGTDLQTRCAFTCVNKQFT